MTKKRTSDVSPPKGKITNTTTLTKRYISLISPYTLRNILICGILIFSSVSIIIYSHLMDIESTYEGKDPRFNTNRNDTITKKEEALSSELDSRLQKSHLLSELDPRLQKNNNHVNPGRAWGSEKGKVACDQDIYRLISYWNDPRSDVDRSFTSPFLQSPSVSHIKRPKRTRYLSFEPDSGGWNNIRMEFEIMVVLAAATGRTLVLPPDNPLYLLNKEQKNKHRGLQTFFSGFDDIVDTISTEDFIQLEMIDKKNYPLPSNEGDRTKLMGSLNKCIWMKKSEISCMQLFNYLTEVADLVPRWHGEKHCLIMDDVNWSKDSELSHVDDKQLQRILQFCGGREPIYYNTQIHDAPLVHFHTHTLKDTRLLVHFYAFIYFLNPEIGNWAKRLVRDRVRYSDEIQCAAGKIVRSLIEESIGRKKNGGGAEAGYFSMHIRRGDFQWPKMRISAEEWHENTRKWLEPDDQHLLYIATDETDRTFFEPLMKHYKVRFLSDYEELAGLSNLDPNFVGMIDQVVASKARDFVGTYFSSFSAYIGRMRGYHNISGKRMFYSHPKYFYETHSWVDPHSSYSAREFPTGWAGIDGVLEPNEAFFR
mmetsp:Transcript_50983/g.58943  ORF Transcript_50983/g.58943 Transcript_50983/m.58943 type:complete len:593 (-) Transcript_50983:75-1853(-)